MANDTSREHNHFLDSLRGLAALWVVFNHTQEYLPNALPEIPSVIRQPLIQYGGLGVQVFFVLSGYVIAQSLQRTRMDTPALGNFMVRRMVRLSPPYWAAVVFALVVSSVSAVAKDEVWSFPSIGRLLAHVVYLPDLLNMEMINGVHWTLYIEVQFYVLIGIFLWLLAKAPQQGSAARLVPLIAFSTIAAASLIHPLFELRDGREHWFGAYVHAFVFGMLIQWTRSKRLHPAVLAVFTAVLGLAWAIHGDSVVGGAFVAGAIVYAFTGPKGAFGLLEQPPFLFLGKISFSLYLVHSPVMGSVSYLGGKVLGESVGAELVTAVFEIIASLIVGAVFWKIFEEPAMRWSKALRRTSSTPAPARAPSLT